MKNIDSVQKPDPSEEESHPEVTISLISTKVSSKKPRRGLKIFGLVALFFIVGIAALGIWRATNLTNKIFVGKKLTFFQKIKEMIAGSTGQVRLIGEDEGQINVLLLGIGGEGHDGPYLTDTIILAQIRPGDGQVVMTSIPRDYFIDIPGFRQAKINEAFSDGYLKHRDYGEGGELAMETVKKLTGIDVSYFAVVDFSGFEKAVDKIGGLDIKIDRTFTDTTFPNDATQGYLPPVTFNEGWEHMDGTRALIFARSRHAAGSEGSDFARSARQQKVIQAFKEKVINLNLLSDSGKINSLLDIFADHFHTNISVGEMLRVYQLAKEKNIGHFLSLSLDPSTNLICPQILPETGAYVLLPCYGKTGEDIKNYFKNAFAIGKISEEKAVVWMASSNHNSTAYQNASRLLTDAGITNWEFTYSGKGLEKNIFYQVNPKPGTAEFLKNTLSAAEVTLPPPNLKIDPSKLDILIILGGSTSQISEPK